jgi:hypothetical protein
MYGFGTSGCREKIIRQVFKMDAKRTQRGNKNFATKSKNGVKMSQYNGYSDT